MKNTYNSGKISASVTFAQSLNTRNIGITILIFSPHITYVVDTQFLEPYIKILPQ